MLTLAKARERVLKRPTNHSLTDARYNRNNVPNNVIARFKATATAVATMLPADCAANALAGISSAQRHSQTMQTRIYQSYQRALIVAACVMCLNVHSTISCSRQWHSEQAADRTADTRHGLAHDATAAAFLLASNFAFTMHQRKGNSDCHSKNEAREEGTAASSERVSVRGSAAVAAY